MKKINEFLMGIYIEEEYTDPLLQDEFDRIFSKVAETVQSERKSKKKITSIKILVVAACIAVLGISTVLAAQHFGWNEILANHFNASQAQQEKLKELIAYPECSVTNNNITIKVLQTLSDTKNIYVIYEIILPEDMVFNDRMYFEHTISDNAGAYSKVLEQAGNKRTAMLHLDFKDDLSSQMIYVVFRNLCESGAPFTKVLFEGEWEVKWYFDVNAHTQIKKVEPNLEVTAFVRMDQIYKTSTIKSIVVSPLSVIIESFDKNGIKNIDHLFATWIIVNMKDGSVIDFGTNDFDRSHGVYEEGIGQMSLDRKSVV